MRKQTTTKATRKRRKQRRNADEEYREWIEQQPSCISGQFSEWVNGEGRSIACHVRRASTSGTGFKPLFACVPLTHTEHATQHQHSEAECLEQHLGGSWTRESAASWFDAQAEHYRKMWEQQNA